MSEYDDLQRVTQRLEFSRRRFLQRAAILGVGAASLPLLAACAPGGPASSPRVVSPRGSPAPTPAGSPRTLEFQAWEFQPETIEQHLDAWTAISGVPVNLTVIPNIGYGPATQTKLQGGATLDVYYNFTYNTGTFHRQGWARDLRDLPGVNDMLEDMFPAARDRYITSDGAIIAAPYFNAVHVLHYNRSHLERAAITAPPESRQDVYDQSKRIKDAGISATPYLAYWVKEFAEEYLNVYFIADGVTMWDATGEPVFADDPKATEILEWWLAMFRDGLTTTTMLTDDPIKLATLMGTGEASFYVLHHYFLKIIRDLEDAPEKDNVDIHYRMPGSAGKTFQMGEVIQLGTSGEGRAVEDAWDLMKFYGWRNLEGEYATFKSWATAAQLGAPYPGFFEDPEVRDAFGSNYDIDALADVFANGSDVQGGRNAAWYQTFQAKVGDRIHAMLLGQASPADTVRGLADDARAAKSGL